MSSILFHSWQELPIHLIAIKNRAKLETFLMDWDVMNELFDMDYSFRLLKYWRQVFPALVAVSTAWAIHVSRAVKQTGCVCVWPFAGFWFWETGGVLHHPHQQLCQHVQSWCSRPGSTIWACSQNLVSAHTSQTHTHCDEPKVPCTWHGSMY